MQRHTGRTTTRKKNMKEDRKAPNVGAGTCGMRAHTEDSQRPLHETMRLAEARLVRHALGGSMPS